MYALGSFDAAPSESSREVTSFAFQCVPMKLA
jgi:hypothetical protein